MNFFLIFIHSFFEEGGKFKTIDYLFSSMGAIVRSYHTIALGHVAYVHHVLTHIFFEIEPKQQTDKTTQPTTTAQFASLSLFSLFR